MRGGEIHEVPSPEPLILKEETVIHVDGELSKMAYMNWGYTEAEHIFVPPESVQWYFVAGLLGILAASILEFRDRKRVKA